MTKKINILILALFSVISIFFILEISEITSLLLSDSNKKIMILIFIFISILVSIFLFVLSLKKEIQVVEKIIYKEKKEEVDHEQLLLKHEEVLKNKAAELSNDLLNNLKSEKDIERYCDKLLINLSKKFNFVQAVFFILNKKVNKYKTVGTFAFFSEEIYREFENGEGLTGQVAKNKKILIINNIPDKYITILSGLGKSSPNHLIILPIIKDDITIGIIEFAIFEKLDEDIDKILMILANEIAFDIDKLIV